MLIIDAQSVKNTDTGCLSGYDAGKKIKGIKRHIAVDSNGLPHAMYISSASSTDRDGAIFMFEKHIQNMTILEKVLVDGGYTGEKFASKIKSISNAEVQVVKRNELHKFVVLPQRWVVERSFAWLDKCKRLHKNCEKTQSSALAMVQLVFIRLLLSRKRL
jgi:transposase